MSYIVTTFDVCVPGFERLRSQSEFILVAAVWPDMSRQELIDGFEDDLQACGRSDGFRYGECRDVIRGYLADVSMRRVLLYVEPADDDGGGGCSAYLCIKDDTDEA